MNLFVMLSLSLKRYVFLGIVYVDSAYKSSFLVYFH